MGYDEEQLTSVEAAHLLTEMASGMTSKKSFNSSLGSSKKGLF